MTACKNIFILTIPKGFGQIRSSKNLEPASKLGVIWNFLYITIYVLIFTGTLCTVNNKEDLFGHKGYSFISQVKYCAQLFGSSALLVFVNVRLTLMREEIRCIYKRLLEMLTDFKRLKILRQHQEPRFIPVVLIIFVPVAAFVIDVIQTPRSIPLLLWICLYLPGINFMVYASSYNLMLSESTERFIMINQTLKEFAYPELSCTEIYTLRKMKIKPESLLRQLSNDGQNMLDKLLILHDENCELSQRLNKTCGPELVLYFGLTSASIISLGYTTILDLIAFSCGEAISETNTRASDFWAIINMFTLFAMILGSSRVKQESEDTLRLLHRLINIYVDLEPFAEIYALQLSHQNVTVSAAGLFILNKSILLRLLSVWATFLVILIQFTG